jgi:glutamyl-tRNA synthetase
MSLSSPSSVDESTRDIIKIIVLKNAIQYGGKARNEIVISKTIAQRPDLRNILKILIPEIKVSVEKINSLTLNEQKVMFAHIAPHEPAPDKKVTRDHDTNLPALQDAEMGNVITRFPPEPNGYPHLGHAKAAIIDEEYARRYNGKLILRFDDTNPLNEKSEYYDAIREGLEWLGIEPDIVKNTSDDIQLLCNYGKKLVEIGGAYVCTCSQPVMRDLRSKGIPCDCRMDTTRAGDLLRKFFGSFEPNAAVLRFKGNMADQNTAMRDPTLFRIIEAHHPKLGNSNRVWPTYDFAAPLEDSLDGVTHALRTKEYELRNPLYFSILERLSLRKPWMLEFSRLEFEGMPVSKRKIKPLIENGLVKGWDDPRLPTLAAIKRRGFRPQAIRKFVLSLGLTLSETKPPFEALEAFNRKIVDSQSIRLFFVRDPVQLQVRNGDFTKQVTLDNHPNINLGHRNIRVSNSFYIAGDDAASIRVGDEIRLMELYNIRIADIKSQHIPQLHGSYCTSSDTSRLIIAEQTGDYLKHDMPKIQWVAMEDALPYRIMIARDLYIEENYNTNSLETCEGFAESYVSALKQGTIIQFVRFGFCRIDGNNAAIFTHR